MEFGDVVRHRRMVRSFRPDAVPDDVLDRLLDTARRGPSAGFTQGTEFLVLAGRGETQPYWDVALPPADGNDFPWPGLPEAPVLVLVLSHKEAYLDRYAQPDKGWTDRGEQRWPVPYWDVDAGMAAMLLLLAAVNEGLGALFFGVFKGWDRIRERFGIPVEYRCVGIVALGFPAGEDRPSGSLSRGRRPADDVIHRGRW